MLKTIEILKEKIGISANEIQNIITEDNLSYEVFLSRFKLKRENVEIFLKEKEFLSFKKKFEIIKDKIIKNIYPDTNPIDVRICYKFNQDSLKIEKYIYDIKNNKINGNIFKTDYHKATLNDYYEDKSELIKKLYALNIESIADILSIKYENIEQGLKKEYIEKKIKSEYKKVNENNMELIKLNIKNPDLVKLSTLLKEILIKEMLNNLSELTKLTQQQVISKKRINGNF